MIRSSLLRENLRRGPHAGRRALWCVLLLWIFVGALRAQDEVVQDLPLEYAASSELDWFTAEDRAVDPRWWERVVERHADDLAAGNHPRVVQTLANEFRAAPWPSHTGLQARFQTQLDRIASVFRDEHAQALASDPRDSRAARARVLAALVQRGVGVQSLLPELEDVNPDPAIQDSVLVFFAGTPDRFATFRSTPDDEFELLLPRELMRDLRLRAEAVRAVLQDYVEPVQRAAYDRIRRADRQWANLLKHGYSVYPWESLFNGWVLEFDAFHPPAHQWILFHPTLGFEASTVGLDGVRANEVLNVDLVGYVHYFGKEYEHFLGGSITAGLRDDLGPGLGVAAHWEKGFSVGVTWHDLDDDDELFDDEPFVFLSFDLFRFVQTERPKYQAQWDRIRGLLDAER